MRGNRLSFRDTRSATGQQKSGRGFVCVVGVGFIKELNFHPTAYSFPECDHLGVMSNKKGIRCNRSWSIPSCIIPHSVPAARWEAAGGVRYSGNTFHIHASISIRAPTSEEEWSSLPPIHSKGGEKSTPDVNFCGFCEN